MTNAPQSPYGPPAPGGQNPPQQPPFNAAPQGPLSAAQFHSPQVPHGYTVVTPAEVKDSNGPGLAALVIGIVSTAVAFIPIVGLLSNLLGLAGIVLGIVGLVLANRPRKQAGWGLGLSVGSMALSTLMSYLYLYGFAAFATSEGWN